MVFIYALIDPFTFKVRYIGKTIRLKERLMNQMNERSNTYRSHWLQSLKSKKKRPHQVILQTLNDSDDWQKAEVRWIAVAKKYGWPLVNCTDGGDGVTNLSGESKARMLKTWKGRKHKPESLEKMRLANVGRVHSEDHKKHMSELMKGRKIEWTDKISKANSKFDAESIAMLKNDLANGMMVIEAAKKYGVHRTTITKIKLNKYPK